MQDVASYFLKIGLVAASSPHWGSLFGLQLKENTRRRNPNFLLQPRDGCLEYDRTVSYIYQQNQIMCLFDVAFEVSKFHKNLLMWICRLEGKSFSFLLYSSLYSLFLRDINPHVPQVQYNSFCGKNKSGRTYNYSLKKANKKGLRKVIYCTAGYWDCLENKKKKVSCGFKQDQKILYAIRLLFFMSGLPNLTYGLSWTIPHLDHL